MAELKLASENPFEDVKAQVDELIDSFRFDQLADQLTRFGRDRPFALALAALTVGVAAGLLMRRSFE